VKCPLLMLGMVAINDAESVECGYTECRERRCAWWDSRSEHCAVHVLAWAMTESIEAQARRVDRYEESH